MTTPSSHPSFLIQDRWAAGLDVPPDARAHLQDCEACAARAASLRTSEPVPGWARALAGAPARPRRATRTWAWAPLSGALAAAAVLLLVSAPPADPDTAPTTSIRGAPSVGVYVAHGEHVSLWDGRRPLAPGDRLRLEVVAEGFTHATVLTPDARGRLRVLHASAVDPRRETLLPPAWRVDDASGDETLVVVLADRVVAPAEVPARTAPAREDLWVRWLRLPKQAGGSR